MLYIVLNEYLAPLPYVLEFLVLAVLYVLLGLKSRSLVMCLLLVDVVYYLNYTKDLMIPAKDNCIKPKRKRYENTWNIDIN